MRRRSFIAGAATWLFTHPVGAASGPKKRLAIISPATAVEEIRSKANAYYRSLFAELARSGFVESENLVVEAYSGLGETSRYGEIVQRAVDAAPDAILCVAGLLAAELKARTRSIPVVAIVADPVASNLVSSLARPDANITGVTVDAGMEIYGKRLSLLAELVPNLTRIGYVSSSRNWDRAAGKAVRTAAQIAGVEIVHVDLGKTLSGDTYRAALAAASGDRLRALLVSDEPEHLPNRAPLIASVSEARIPAMYPFRELTAAGGLLSYSVDLVQVYRIAGSEVAQIFAGTAPSDIPFVQPTVFQLTLNLRTARELNLTVPPLLLAQADQVIE